MHNATTVLLLVAAITVFFTGAKSDTKQFNCGVQTEMSESEQKATLDQHNRLRASLANGREMNSLGHCMPKASNMLKLTWNCTIQKNAQKEADRCEMVHSTNLGELGFGENIAYSSSTHMTPEKLEKIGPERTTKWFNELGEYYIDNPTNVYGAVEHNGGVGHFTQVAWAETAQIGCGKCVTPVNGKTRAYILCQYYPAFLFQIFECFIGNYRGRKIYEIGEPGSACPSGTKRTSEGLCA